MRQPKPYFKTSHNAWYANIGPKSRPIRLAKQEEGEQAAWDKYHELMAGRQPVNSDTRAAEILDIFLDYHAKNSARATYQFYFPSINSFAHYIGPKLRLADLKPHHVYDWIERNHRTYKRNNKPTSDNYRHNLIRAVKAAFRWAEEREHIDRSPVRNVKLPPTRPRDVYLMPEQWDKLVAEVSKAPDKGCLLDILVALKETGCRPQEARQVEARHFNDNEACWVFPIDESKGGRERRVVLLTDRVTAICQQLAIKNPEGPMFRNSIGNPWTRRALSNRLYRLSKKLDFHVCPYAVRHTFATDAIIRGVDLQTIATLMGHVDLKMLNRIYQHIHKRSDHLRAGLRKAVGK